MDCASADTTYITHTHTHKHMHTTESQIGSLPKKMEGVESLLAEVGFDQTSSGWTTRRPQAE